MEEDYVMTRLFNSIKLDKMRIATEAEDGKVTEINGSYYMGIDSGYRTLCLIADWNDEGKHYKCHVARDMGLGTENCTYRSICNNKMASRGSSISFLNVRDLVFCEYNVGMSLFKCRLIIKNYGRYL